MKPLILLTVALALTGCAPKSPEAVFASMVVSPKDGTAGPIKLGMTVDQAIGYLGAPESRYADFVSWRGGKFTAVLAGETITRLRISDPTISIAGFHVGQDLTAAKKTFPQGAYENDEVPVYELKDGGHAWLEVMPTVEKEVLAVVISSDERQGHHD